MVFVPPIHQKYYTDIVENHKSIVDAYKKKKKADDEDEELEELEL